MFGARGVCKDGHALGLDCFFCGADHISVLAVENGFVLNRPNFFSQIYASLITSQLLGVRSDVCE